MAGSVKLLTPAGGSVTINAGDTASALSITLPATTDTITTNASTQTLTNKTLTAPTISSPQIITGATINHTGSSDNGALLIGDITTPTSNTSLYLRSTSKCGINFSAGGVLAFNGAGDGSSERMRIDSSGRLLIGTTSYTASSAELFEVYSSGNGISLFTNNSSGYAPVYIKNASTTATTDIPFIVCQDSGANRAGMYINTSNNMVTLSGQGGFRFLYGGSSPAPLEAMRLDSSGRMTIPYQPSFKAQLTTNTNYSVGVAKHTPFTTVHWNTGNCYSTSTGRFTAPVAGYYLFEGNESTGSNATASGYLSFEFYINGTRMITGWNYKTAGYQKEYSTAVFYLNANDYVEVGFESQQAITFLGTSTTNYTYTYFSGRLLG